jgi:hypothetical protein
MPVRVDPSQSFRAGVPWQLFKLPTGTTYWDASADLKLWVLAVLPSRKELQSLSVMVNWTAGLNK